MGFQRSASKSPNTWTEEQTRDGQYPHLAGRVARFIDAAEESLFLQNERYQDEVIIERLVRATRRGVEAL